MNDSLSFLKKKKIHARARMMRLPTEQMFNGTGIPRAKKIPAAREIERNRKGKDIMI